MLRGRVIRLAGTCPNGRIGATRIRVEDREPVKCLPGRSSQEPGVLIFEGALVTVRGLIDLADRIATIVEDRDVAADAGRHLAEKSLVRVWASFQRFAEATSSAPGQRHDSRQAQRLPEPRDVRSALERGHRQDLC